MLLCYSKVSFSNKILSLIIGLLPEREMNEQKLTVKWSGERVLNFKKPESHDVQTCWTLRCVVIEAANVYII